MTKKKGVGQGKGGGHPRTFASGEELLGLWGEYIEGIRRGGWAEVPTKTGFCRWMEQYGGCDPHTIYLSLAKYYPSYKKEFDDMWGDAIAEGAMLSHFQPSMSIFSLKNWTQWKDKQEIQQDTTVRVVLGDDAADYVD